jgi:hypothetical protein
VDLTTWILITVTAGLLLSLLVYRIATNTVRGFQQFRRDEMNSRTPFIRRDRLPHSRSARSHRLFRRRIGAKGEEERLCTPHHADLYNYLWPANRRHDYL